MYSVILLRIVGMNDFQIRAAMESQLNDRAQDGFYLSYAFESEGKMFLIMKKQGRGRPRKDEEVTDLEG